MCTLQDATTIERITRPAALLTNHLPVAGRINSITVKGDDATKFSCRIAGVASPVSQTGAIESGV
jgi:hypothetical protein